MNGYCNGDAAWHREQQVKATRVLTDRQREDLIGELVHDFIANNEVETLVLDGCPGFSNMRDCELMVLAKHLPIYEELNGALPPLR